MKRLFKWIFNRFTQQIQVRLTCYFLFILIPLVMISLFSNFKSQEILREQAGERTRGAMTSAMEYIDLSLQNIEHLSTLITTDSTLLKLLHSSDVHLTRNEIYDFSQIIKGITSIMAVNHNLSSISIMHAPTEMVLSTNFGGKRIPGITDQPWVDYAYQARGTSVLYIPSNDFIYDENSIFSRDSISIIRTMDIYNPQLISNILIINIKKSALLNLTKALLPSENAQIYLLTNENEIVASTDKEHTSFYSQEDMFTVQVKSRYSDWTLMMVQPEIELYAETRQISLFTYIIIGVSIIMALWISWIVYSGISSPLESLSHGMKQLRIGNLNIQLPNRRKDELGYLTSSFNQMVLDQKHLIENYYEQQLRLSKTELKFLQSQINPHFLYNTLDSIYWTAKNYEAEEISEMVLNLSKFFRLSLDKGRETFTVQETIEHLNYYIRVQQLRFNNQFSVFYEISDESKHIPLLKLLLQPLVENALLHGLEKQMSNGQLMITSHIDENLLWLQVRDNGIGIPAERLEYIDKQLKEGTNTFQEISNVDIQMTHDLFALKNVYSRIKMYYGKQAEFTIDSKENEGTTVMIKLPLDKCIEAQGGETA